MVASSMFRRRWSFWDIFTLLLTMAGSVRLFIFALRSSQDFAVYWKAVHSWLQGLSPYVYSAEDLGFVFKYPPWMIPVLAPLGALEWEAAQWIWAAFELLLLLGSVRWMMTHGVRRSVALVSAFLFWWIWLAHFSAGQITLVLLGCGLFAAGIRKDNAAGTAAGTLLIIVFSSKLFSLVTLLGDWKRFFRWKVVAAVAVFLVLAHGAVLSLLPEMTLSELYRAWADAASSGGAELGKDVVRGQGNHGFTAALLRWFGVAPTAFHFDVAMSVFLTVAFGMAWTRFSRMLRFEERWAGWLALGLLVHPLAWHHSFVLAFPLCTFALERAVASRRKLWIGLALLGIAGIALFIPQVIGKTLVKPLELAGCKAWGTLLCAAVLVLAGRPAKAKVVP